MPDEYVSIDGDAVGIKDLLIPKAREFATVLATGDLPYVNLVGLLKNDDIKAEVVVFDAEVQLGQKNVHDIKDVERIAAFFSSDDSVAPMVLALRVDFPEVPHLYPGTPKYPTILCLYEEKYSELKLRWTPIRFLERIREWLALTAKGKLHGADQPLEPLLTGAHGYIVVSPELFESNSTPEILVLEVIRNEKGNVFLVAESNQVMPETGTNPTYSGTNPTYLGITLKGEPQTHGIIRQEPKNLAELTQFLVNGKIDLLSELRRRLSDLLKSEHHEKMLDASLILMLALPKTRGESSTVETNDVWTFLVTKSIKEIGKDIGIWNVLNGKVGLLIPVDETKTGDNTEVYLLNPTFPFSRDLASFLNGLPSREKLKITAIGLGALGSQVFMNLLRSGCGEWTLIDDDTLLPHNLARHALMGYSIGRPKTDSLAHFANSTIKGDPIAVSIVADVLNPGENAEKVKNSLQQADIILDISTSISVARYLARDIDSKARRISMFLNPSGTDVVLLAEGSNRDIPIDCLEMQYYRLLINDNSFEHHLSRIEGQLRYANSCRDISSSIPQDLVALHAAICSRSFHKVISDQDARISIWQANPEDLNVKNTVLSPKKMFEIKIDDWTLYTDSYLENKIFNIRKEKLPNETGGILIGSFDMQRKIVYVVDTVPSPEDSKEWPTVYIRGSQGLKQHVERIEKVTGGMLGYVGEWHSHPDGVACRPSDDDLKAFIWLSDRMGLEGYPGLMLIAGEKEQSSWYVGKMIR